MSATRSAAAGRLRGSLGPVAETLVDEARRRADAIRAAADTDARAALAEAGADAARIVADARAGGDQAAARQGATRLAATRREARETVLAARRQAYEALRRGAIEALARSAATPDGRRLAGQLEALVRLRVGGPASVHRAGPGSLAVEAESGNRHAALDPSALVDQALESLAAEVESLWR